MRLKNEMALSSSSSSYTYVGKRKKEEGEKVQDLETRRREKRGEFLLLSRRLRAEEKKLDRLWTGGPTDRPTDRGQTPKLSTFFPLPLSIVFPPEPEREITTTTASDDATSAATHERQCFSTKKKMPPYLQFSKKKIETTTYFHFPLLL